MKTTEILTLGAIVAGIFVFNKYRATAPNIGAVQRRKTLPWFLKNKAKLDSDIGTYKLLYWYEKPKINSYKSKQKEFSSVEEFVSFWEQALFWIQRNGYKITQATLTAYDKEGDFYDVWQPVIKHSITTK